MPIYLRDMVDRAIYIGYNGAIAQQMGIDVLSNNIVNVNTVGYRAQRPTFSDLFSRKDKFATETTNPLQSGHGSVLRSIDTIFQQGEVKSSNIFSDLAINGSGFFVLKDSRMPGPYQTFYTRAGNFEFDSGVETAGSAETISLDGTVIGIRDLPEYSYLPRLIDGSTGRIVQGYLADNDGVIQTGSLTDLTVNPAAVDEANESENVSITGTLSSATPDYLLTLMGDDSNGQLSEITGSYNNNQDRGRLSVSWDADGAGSWQFLKPGQTIPDATNKGDFDSGTVKRNSTMSFIPGIVFRTQDMEIETGSFTALVGPFDVQTNTTDLTSVEGAYLGSKDDGILTIKTAAGGTVSWTFTPDSMDFVSESGSGSFAAADSSISTIIPGMTLRKTAGTNLGAGTIRIQTHHSDNDVGTVLPLFDDSTEETQHTVGLIFKEVQPHEYGYMAYGQTQESFADSSISSLSNAQKQINTYANIDPNQITVRTYANPTVPLDMAHSAVTVDTAENLVNYSLRGGYWGSDYSGSITMTINADGSGEWSFQPASASAPSDSGTFATGTLRPNTTYGLDAGNEIISGLTFTTGSAISAGDVTIESTIGNYSTYNNAITFSPSYSETIGSLSKFLVDYKFDSSVFTNATATNGTNRYYGNLQFDSNGLLIAANSTSPVITLTPNSTLDTVEITPDVSDIKQLYGESDVQVASYDGNLKGWLQQLQFDSEGRLIGSFTNKRQKYMAQLALAEFSNPGGLARAGDTTFQQTAASGTPTIQPIDQMDPGIASILPRNLEYSNSSLADELSDLIFFQRAFQFSGRSIRAADELVQNAIALKR